MADLINLGFEEQGALPGQARGWHARSSLSASEVAGWSRVTGDAPAPSPNAFAGYSALNATAVDGAIPNPYDPDGEDGAAVVTDDGTSGLHRIREPAGRDMEPGRAYTFGAYLKAGTYAQAGPYASVSPTDVRVACDLSAGTVDFAGGPPDDTVVAAVSGEVVNLPGGWHRVSLSLRMADAAAPAFVAPGVAFYADSTTGDVVYAGSGQDFYVWGFFFHEGELSGAESFDAGWGNEVWPTVLTVGEDAELATFPADPLPPEEFEGFEHWVSPYDLVLGPSAAAAFDPDGEEGFRVGWDNDTWASALSGDVAAEFDPDDFEGFEGGWLNDAWSASLTSTEDALFGDDLAEASETFEGVLPDTVVECDPTPPPPTDVFTASGHPFANGDRLFLISAGLLPAGFLKTIPYYVINTTPGVNFQLSLTPGGAVVNATTAGEGEITARADAARYWDGPSLNPTI